jgi:hypothetical protein
VVQGLELEEDFCAVFGGLGGDGVIIGGRGLWEGLFWVGEFVEELGSSLGQSRIDVSLADLFSELVIDFHDGDRQLAMVGHMSINLFFWLIL